MFHMFLCVRVFWSYVIVNHFNFSITVWMVVQTVLTATFNSYGIRQISTPPHKINTPEPIDKKIGTIHYIREGTSYTEFGRNPFTKGFWANGWNITKIIIYLFIYTFFLWSAYRSEWPVDGFLRAIAQKMWNHARMCLFGVIKLKFNIKPLFNPRNRGSFCLNKWWMDGVNNDQGG